MTNLNDLLDTNAPPIWRVVYGDYTYELCSENRALVYKKGATKHSYEITESGCNCPSRMFRNKPCKHEKPIVRLDVADEDTIEIDEGMKFFDDDTDTDEESYTDNWLDD